MKKHRHSGFVVLFLFCFLVLGNISRARSVAIATSGGDQNVQVDRWRRENIEQACQAFAAKGIRDCRQVFNKEAFLENLGQVVEQFECGDTLILYFMGHGSRREGFVFDREPSRSEDRLLSEEEIAGGLQNIACCARVYVAFHSCFSGRYTERLAQDPHVVVAVSSSGRTQEAHKKQQGIGVNPRNWPDGFVTGFGRGGNLAEAFQRGAQQGKADAEATGGNKTESWDDDPQDFKRGHIEEATDTPDGLRVRLRVGGADVTVLIPKSRRTNIPAIRTQDLQVCMDITVNDEAQFNDDNQFAPEGPAVVIEAVNEAVFHVLEVVNPAARRVRVVVVKPSELCCAPREVTLDELPAGIAFCQYFQARIGTTGNRWTAGDLIPTTGDPYPIAVKGHVIEADLASGVVVIDMEEPVKGPHTIQLKAGQSFPSWVRICNRIELTGQVMETEVQEGEDVDAQIETFKGHLDAFDPATGTMTITMNNDNRDGVRSLTFPALLPPADGAPGTLPGNVAPCNDVIFRGRLRGDIIEEANSVNRI